MDIPEKLYEILAHEGVVSLVTQGDDEPHIANTWNSYVQVDKDNNLLAPVFGMKATEANLQKHNKLLLTLGSKEVQGMYSEGAGFLISASAKFIYEGEEFLNMKKKFPWSRAVIKIIPTTIKQTL